MICPYCHTQNRDDQDNCYHCNRDLSMLRLIVNKAKHHYNIALEHAERGRYAEAIIELQNTLELDRHNINAHVVLGTVYARLGQIDKAKKQWAEALELEPMLTKAHDYILRSETLTRSLPKLKLATYIIIILLIALVVNVALTFFTSPKKEAWLLQQAWNKYLNRDYAATLKILDQLETTAKQQPQILASSGILKEGIQNYLNAEIQAIKQAQREKRYYDALAQTKQVLDRNPPPEIRGILISMTQDVRQILTLNLNNLLKHYYNRQVSFARTNAELKKFIRAFSGEPEAKKMEEKLKEIQRDFLARSLDKLKEVAKGGDKQGAINEAEELLKKFPQNEYSAAIENFIYQTKEEIITDLIVNARAALVRENFAENADLLRKARELLAELKPAQRNSIMEILKDVEKERSEKYIAALKKFFLRKNYKSVLELEKLKDLFQLTPAQRKIAEKTLDNAHKYSVASAYRWLKTRDRLYKNLTISDADARRTKELCEFLLNSIVQEGYDKKLPYILFYHGAAYLKLGEGGKAEKIFKELEEKFPQHPYTKTAEALWKLGQKEEGIELRLEVPQETSPSLILSPSGVKTE